jgi:tetratricopeptide (TPR) repeat protein
MKKSYQLILVIVFGLSLNFCNTYADDFTEAMLNAKKNLKAAADNFNKEELIKVRGEFERIKQLKKDIWLVDYYIAYTDYNIALTEMESEDKDEIKKYTKSGLDVINKSIELKDDFSDAYVLKVSLNFNRWQYEPGKMNDIISEVKEANILAEKYDAGNPRYYLVNGISKYWTPTQFGGGVEEALPDLNRSNELFETRIEPSELYPDWGYDWTLGYLALCMIKRNEEGDMDKAGDYIEKALEVNPESGFIKDFVKKEYEKANEEKK